MNLVCFLFGILNGSESVSVVSEINVNVLS